MGRHNLRCVRSMVLMICVGLTSATSTVVKSSPTQRQAAKKTETDSQSKPVAEQAQLRVQLKQASEEFKSNLERLLVLYEADANRAEERLPKMKELLAQGLVTRGEVQTTEDAAAREVTLPLYPGMCEDDVVTVTQAIRQALHLS